MNSRKCRYCLKSCTEILDLGSQPYANSLLKTRYEPETYYPLQLLQCEGCGLVQSLDFDAPIFTSEYPFRTSINKTYVKECHTYVDHLLFIGALSLSDTVLEIGCNDGYLLKKFSQLGIECGGVEPVLELAQMSCEYGEIVQGFFGKTFKGNFDLIIANNVLAHVDDLRGFVEGIDNCLSKNGKVWIEVQSLGRMIVDSEWDTVYHEHKSYFDFQTLENIFGEFGFKILKFQMIKSHGGSFRILFQRSPEKFKPGKVIALNSLQDEVYFSKQIILNQVRLMKNDNKRIALFGAPAKATVFCNYTGLGSEYFDFVVDDTKSKQGKFLPGVRLPIFETELLENSEIDNVIITAWNHLDDILTKHPWLKKFKLYYKKERGLVEYR